MPTEITTRTPSFLASSGNGDEEHQPADAWQHQSPHLSLSLVGSAGLHPRCRLGPNTVKQSWAWGCLCLVPTPSFPCGLPSRPLPTGHSAQMLAGDRGGWRCRTCLFLLSADTPIIGGSTSCRWPPCEVLVPDYIGPVGLDSEDTPPPRPPPWLPTLNCGTKSLQLFVTTLALTSRLGLCPLDQAETDTKLLDNAGTYLESIIWIHMIKYL